MSKMQIALSKIFVFTWILFGSSGWTHAAVWEVTHEWSVEWEKTYSQWVQNQVSDDFFSRFDSTYRQKLDLADVPWAVRTVFAFENGLPMTYRSKLDSRVFVTQESKKFDSVPEGAERLRAFLNYLVVNLLDSHTLHRDTFPLEVNRDAMTAGAVWITYQPERDLSLIDVKLITGVNSWGHMTHVTGTAKSALTALTRRSFAFAFQPDHHDGIKAFRWPHKKPAAGLVQHESLQDGRYGLGQYLNRYWPELYERETGLKTTFSWLVQNTLSAHGPLGPVQKMEQIADDLRWSVSRRIRWVQDAVDFLAAKRGESPDYVMKKGSAEYNKFSTPMRDAQLRAEFEVLKQFGVSSKLIRETLAQQKIEISAGRLVSLLQYLERADQRKLSADPNDSLEKRWGEY